MSKKSNSQLQEALSVVVSYFKEDEDLNGGEAISAAVDFLAVSEQDLIPLLKKNKRNTINTVVPANSLAQFFV